MTRWRRWLALVAVAGAVLSVGAIAPSMAGAQNGGVPSAQATARFWLDGGEARLNQATPLEHELRSFRALSEPDGAGRAGNGKSGPTPIEGLGKVYFIGADGKPHWCTGVAVRSTHRNVVATAGRCVTDGQWNATELVFVPDPALSGPPSLYVVRAVHTHYDWRVYEDGDRDYAFLSLYDGVRLTGKTLRNVGPVGDVAGAQGIRFDLQAGEKVQLHGHTVGVPNQQPHIGVVDETFPVVSSAIKAEELLAVRASNRSATSVGTAWLTNFENKTKSGLLAGITLGTTTDNSGVTISVSTTFDGETQAVFNAAQAVAGGPIV